MFEKLKKKIEEIKNDGELTKDLDAQAKMYNTLSAVRKARKEHKKQGRS